MSVRPSMRALALLASLCLIAPAAAQESLLLDTIVVEGGAAGAVGVGGGGGLTTQGYVARDTAIGTKTDTDVRKIPQSIGTVSAEELQDRNVQSLVEATRYTAGVRAGQYGFDPRFDTLVIRGFDVTTTGYYRDGLRSAGGSFAVFRHEPYLLQGVSILKGPSSVLYGAGSPGGLVNVISKRPTETPFREVEAQYGSFRRVQGNADISGPLGENDNLLYRLTGVWRSADTEFVAVRDDRISVAPALTLRSDDQNTQLTILGEYTDILSGGATGWISFDGRITDIEYGDPRYRDYDHEQWRIGYEFSHAFNESLTFRQNLRYQEVDADLRWVSVTSLSEDGQRGLRTANRLVDRSANLSLDNQLQADFQTGGIAHTLLGGLDYVSLDRDYGYAGGFPAPDLDLATRNYGANPITPVGPVPWQTNTQQEQLGLYLQDQAEYGGFVLTAGGRYDWLSTDTRDLDSDSLLNADDDKFTGRIGLAYLFDNGLSPYVSYSTSFAPTTGADRFGNPFEPTTGRQEEVGLRYMPDDLNLSVQAALFRIRQSSILQTVSSAPFIQEQTGEVQSRGFEVEATTGITDHLAVTAAYTYLDMENREGVNRGNFPAGIPEHQASLWADYDVTVGPLQGLGLGGGVRFIGSSFVDEANSRRNASRTLFDATLSYDFGARNVAFEGVSAQISAKNVFDEQKVTCTDFYCYREEGRNVIGSLKYSF